MPNLTIVRCDDLDDWYTIELAEHSNTEWWEDLGDNCFAYCHSGRISDASVEGSLAEMKEIAAAIRNRSSVDFRRCAVRCDDSSAYFCSPRNSEREGSCTLAEADNLASQIEAVKEGSYG
jgi:hypothetical protein